MPEQERAGGTSPAARNAAKPDARRTPSPGGTPLAHLQRVIGDITATVPTETSVDPAAAVELLRAPGDADGVAVQRLSAMAGNRWVAQLLTDRPASTPRTAAVQRAGDAPVVQREDGASAVETQAEEIYDALNWVDDVPRAMRALRAAHPNWVAVQSAFNREHGSIWEYLKDQLSTSEVIEAYAYFMRGHTNDLHVALARAILPTGTRDAEIHRILQSVPAARRSQLADQYQRDYSDLGEGTLRDDLISDQSGWELEKSLALLDHDLNDAEQLYLDSVAITGTHTDSVISRLQRIAGASDPNAFAAFESQWNTFVSGTSGWTTAPPEVFTDMGLREAMVSELSGEEAGLALAAIDHGRRRSTNADGAVPEGMPGAPEGAAALSEDQVLADEDIRLEMHMAYIDAAAEGAGTNEQQMFDAVDAIRTIWATRIRRAEDHGDADLAAEHRRRWEATRARIRPIVNDEMDEEGVENLRIRLLLAGSLTPADQLYLAKVDFDKTAAVRTVTDAWAAGEISTLRQQASEARIDDAGRTLRPSFDPLFTVPVTSGLPFRRIALLLNTDLSDAEQGARRLKLELDDGTADADCKRALEFLRTTGITAARRAGIITAFNAMQGVTVRDGDTPQRAFLTWLAERYENSAATWDMRDLIDPSTEPDELVTRARGRHDAAHSGIMDHVVTDLARDWGHMTGEDTVEVEQEALRRLEFIASSDTSAEELQAMMSLTGTTSVNELAELQYDEYQARLTELRDLKATIAEGLATAVEVLAAAALTVATAGAAGGALVAAVGSAIAGMVAREALQGTDYELFDEENAKRLLITAISGGVAEYIGPAVRNLEAIERLGAASAFVRGALTEGSKSITSEGMSTLLAEHMPTVEILTANALKVLGSTLGNAMSARMAGALDDLPIEAQIIPSIRASIAANMVSGVSDHASTLTTGTGDLTAVDIAGGFALRIARSVGEGTASGLADVGATSRRAPTPQVDGDDDHSPEPTSERDPDTAGRKALAAAHTVDGDGAALSSDQGAGGHGGGDGGGHVPPGNGRGPDGGGGGGGGENPFAGLTDAEIDAAAGTTSPLGPVDSQAAPGRSARAVPVGEIDRTQPLGVSGFAGSTSATPGFGAFAHTITTERGDQVPAVIKILPPGAADVFAREVAGAQATATAGVGPPYYGIVDVPDGLAFAMGVVPGGFTENFSLDPEGSPQHTLAEQQTQHAVGALTSQAPQDVRNYAAALVHLGYHCTGDLQGLVADDGRWRPIDFSQVSPLSDDPGERAEQMATHHRVVEGEASGLERTLAERAGAGGPPGGT